MRFITIGLNELEAEFRELADRIPDVDLVAKGLAEGMQKYVHHLTGYLASTIHYENNIAGASASYAGYEAGRGGEHDFPELAIQALTLDNYVEWLMGAFK